MKKKTLFIELLILILSQLCFAQSSLLDGFVFIKGGTFSSGDVVTDKNRPLVRVNDFEMLDHPVTNAEYKRFIDATGFPAPLHWKANQIPAGKEDYPVIFVNRYDVDAYLDWLTENDNRVYRLPTTMEFEWASRGGLEDKKIPMGRRQTSRKSEL